jgi:hypothetical protein
MGGNMANVFISYAREQSESASDLGQKLVKRGFTIWMDKRLPAGANFNDTIREELEKADAVVVIWSPEAAQSNYVKMEAGIAWAWDKLLPARLSSFPTPAIPDPFTPLQTIDVADIEGLVGTLKSWDIAPASHQKMTMDEFLSALLKDSAHAALPAFLQKVKEAGFKVVFKQTILFKSTIPGFQQINFGGIIANGTVNTNYISDWAEQVGDPSIALEYLDQVAALIENATVKRENASWTWRVEVWGSLPKLSLLLEKGDAWIDLMKRAREGFVMAAASREAGLLRKA